MIVLRSFCILFVIFSSYTVEAIIPESERNALIQMGTLADPLLNSAWSGTIGTECSWYGITCDNDQNHVTQISLASGYQEFITMDTAEISQLLFLESLDYNNDCFIPLNCLSETELDALRSIYQQNVGSPNRLNWFESNHPCFWFGVTCDEQQHHVIKLSLIGLNINQLTADIGLFPALTELSLGANFLTSLPPEIGQLTQLEKLSIAQNKLTALPDEIGQLVNLQELQLNSNNLTTLPASIDQLSSLSALFLKNNKITMLPPEIGGLSQLSILNLNSNQLSTLPAEFGLLKRLEFLDLHANQLTAIPSEIAQLIHLSELQLSDNQLTELPTEFGQLINLTILHLHSNQLRELPAGIGRLKSSINTNNLTLHHNKLKSLPAEIGELELLTVLDLSFNRLTSLPPEIGKLDKLEVLQLHSNQLTELPAEIGQLTQLGQKKTGSFSLYSSYNNDLFSLRDNLLTVLPAEIGQLSHLSTLNVSHNQLSSVPLEIFNIKALKNLDLSFNLLTSLPNTFARQSMLTSVNLSGNNLSDLPAGLTEIKEELICFSGCKLLPVGLSVANNCLNPTNLSTEVTAWLNSEKVVVDDLAFATQQDICSFTYGSMPAFINQYAKDGNHVDFVNMLESKTETENAEYHEYAIYPFGSQQPYSVADALITGIVEYPNEYTWRIRTDNLDNSQYDVVFWSKNDSVATISKAWKSTFTNMPAASGLMPGYDLTEFFNINSADLAPLLNLQYAFYAEDPSPLNQLLQLPGLTRLQHNNGILLLSKNERQYSVKPVEIMQSNVGDTPGYQFTSAGMVQFQTKNQRTILAASILFAPEKFATALLQYDLSVTDTSLLGEFKLKTDTFESDAFYYARPDIFSSPAQMQDFLDEGIFLLPVSEYAQLKNGLSCF